MDNKTLTVTMDWDTNKVTLEWSNSSGIERAEYDVKYETLSLKVLRHIQVANVWGYEIKYRGFV